MAKAIDLTEHRFGKLVAKSRGENDSSGHSQWYCLCDCQIDKPTNEQQLYLVRTTSLTQNVTTSCPNCRIPSSHNIKKYNTYDLTGEYGVGITSNTNEEFYFDLEDYDLIKGYTWCVDSKGYLRAANTNIRMHNLVMQNNDTNLMADHIHHNKLDNRKNQLRLVTNSQNQMNKDIGKTNTSGVRGVSWHKRKQKWISQIGLNGKLIYLGIFDNKEDAIFARKQAEQIYFGEYNFKRKENNMKPTLYMMIGLSGSGKSTYAKQLAEEQNAIILSSDALREELYNDVNDQVHNNVVFAELHKRCKEELKRLNNIIYDATNINQKQRTAFLKELKNIDCCKKAIIMATPYELCLQNNKNRDRQVPEYVIKRQRENFHFPLYNEGFDEIEFVWNMGNMKFDVVKLLENTMCFDQKNHHHTLTLGEHMLKAAKEVLRLGYLPENEYGNLFTATRLHDIGKLETQTFADKKGNPSEEAHYYGHNFVGSYNAMFYLNQYDNGFYTDNDILHICTLVQYHMHPYLGWKTSEKARNRDRRLLGDEWYEEVMVLHECDVAAH